MAWLRRNMDKNKAIDLNETNGLENIFDNDNFYSQLAFVSDQFQMNVIDMWTRNVDKEAKKRNEIEDQLKKQEEELRKSKKMCMSHSIKIAKLEARLDMKDARSGTGGSGSGSGSGSSSGGDVEEIKRSSCNQNFPSLEDTVCLACDRRQANMVWFPCRHLSICNRCEGDATECPACRCKRFGSSLKISRPDHHKP